MASAVVLATAGYDHKIRFWEASREKCTRVLRFPESQVNALSITNDKHYIAAVGNVHAKIFEVHHGEGNAVRSYEAHTGNVTAVGFQADAQWMYTGGEDKTVKIWDLRAPRWQRQYECPAAVNSVVLHPTRMALVSGDQGGNVRVWDLQQNACIQAIQ
jgi:target of rapamycin complex subunit LST8